jgi:uncharacterized membrane protein (DUF441 family)
MEVHEAIDQIGEIRRQLARAEVFRGYRALPVAGSGVLAFAAAAVQPTLVGEPRERLGTYLTLWLGAAMLSAVGAGIVMARRAARRSNPWARRLTWQAVEALVPSLVVGALLTVVVVRHVPTAASLLPGLWQLFFSLGVFASLRWLPKATFWVAIFYLLTGLGTLAWFPGDSAFAPWVMGLPFGMGQALAAAILYWTLERDDESVYLEG